MNTYSEKPQSENGAKILIIDDDDQLRLIFTCCHPSLAVEAQIALTLKTLGGLTVGEIAAAFLVSETTMAQRLVRRLCPDCRTPYPAPDLLVDKLGK